MLLVFMYVLIKVNYPNLTFNFLLSINFMIICVKLMFKYCEITNVGKLRNDGNEC